jgi:hypothetical protein
LAWRDIVIIRTAIDGGSFCRFTSPIPHRAVAEAGFGPSGHCGTVPTAAGMFAACALMTLSNSAKKFLVKDEKVLDKPERPV